jgi:uncharacterized protein (TIGR02145 family)
MRKMLSMLSVLTMLLFAVSAMAQTKVVVVPLGGPKPTGDAAAAEVLEGRTFSNQDDVGLDGAMVDNGAQAITPGTSSQAIAQGYHNGSGSVAGDAGLLPENIAYGVTIFGVTGTAPPHTVTHTVTSAGRTWMDRNLGASRVATTMTDEAAYGDLYQWGRGADGHERRSSGNTEILSGSNTPGHGDFIIPPSPPYDWLSSPNPDLWQGVSGTNNPCPAGFRLPTAPEWQTELTFWSETNYTGAYNSPLKLVPAGYRYYSNGTLYSAGSYGIYWSATVDGNNSRYLYFYSSVANVNGNSRAYGHSVRCLED